MMVAPAPMRTVSDRSWVRIPKLERVLARRTGRGEDGEEVLVSIFVLFGNGGSLNERATAAAMSQRMLYVPVSYTHLTLPTIYSV